MSDLRINNRANDKPSGSKNSYGLNEAKDSWKVRSGDSLWKIAQEVKKIQIKGKSPYQSFNVPQIIDALKKANGLNERGLIRPNQVLQIPIMSEPTQAQELNKPDLSKLEQKREDFYDGRLNKILSTHSTVNREKIENLFDAASFSPTSNTVKVLADKTLSHSLLEFIKITGNKQNKEVWQKIFKDIDLPMDKQNLQMLQKLYVSYMLSKLVKAGFNINQVRTGSVLSFSDGKYSITESGKEPHVLDTDNFVSNRVVVSLNITEQRVNEENGKDTPVIIPPPQGIEVVSSNQTDIETGIKDSANGLLSIPLPETDLSNHDQIDTRIDENIVGLILDGASMNDIALKVYESDHAAELVSNVIESKESVLTPEKKMEFLMALNIHGDGSKLDENVNVFFAGILANEMSNESLNIIVELLGDSKYLELQEKNKVNLALVRKCLTKQTESLICSALNDNARKIWGGNLVALK